VLRLEKFACDAAHEFGRRPLPPATGVQIGKERNGGVNDPVRRFALSPQYPFGVVHATVPGVHGSVDVQRRRNVLDRSERDADYMRDRRQPR